MGSVLSQVRRLAMEGSSRFARLSRSGPSFSFGGGIKGRIICDAGAAVDAGRLSVDGKNAGRRMDWRIEMGSACKELKLARRLVAMLVRILIDLNPVI